MKQEPGKYYLRYAWFPKRLNNGKLTWLKKYHEAHLDLPILEPVYTIHRLSEEEYLIAILRGYIVDGYDYLGTSYAYERMLNASMTFI